MCNFLINKTIYYFRLTLSERFGKMAQWSADRSNAMQNMRITRGAASDGGALTVRIEEMGTLGNEQSGDPFDGSPPHRFTSVNILL